MISFTYTITHTLGLHARPAALLADVCKSLTSQVSICKEGRSASASGLVSLLLLEVRQGDTVTISLEGPDEAQEAQALEAFFRANL